MGFSEKFARCIVPKSVQPPTVRQRETPKTSSKSSRRAPPAPIETAAPSRSARRSRTPPHTAPPDHFHQPQGEYFHPEEHQQYPPGHEAAPPRSAVHLGHSNYPTPPPTPPLPENQHYNHNQGYPQNDANVSYNHSTGHDNEYHKEQQTETWHHQQPYDPYNHQYGQQAPTPAPHNLHALNGAHTAHTDSAPNAQAYHSGYGHSGQDPPPVYAVPLEKPPHGVATDMRPNGIELHTQPLGGAKRSYKILSNPADFLTDWYVDLQSRSRAS